MKKFFALLVAVVFCAVPAVNAQNECVVTCQAYVNGAYVTDVVHDDSLTVEVGDVVQLVLIGESTDARPITGYSLDVGFDIAAMTRQDEGYVDFGTGPVPIDVDLSNAYKVFWANAGTAWHRDTLIPDVDYDMFISSTGDDAPGLVSVDGGTLNAATAPGASGDPALLLGVAMLVVETGTDVMVDLRGIGPPGGSGHFGDVEFMGMQVPGAGGGMAVVHIVPEPATMGLLSLGFAGMAALRRRRRRA